jgi:hypothetical protein
VFSLARFRHVRHRFLLQRQIPGPETDRRTIIRHRFKQVGGAAAALCVIGSAAAAGWMLSGGTLTLETLFPGQRELVAVTDASGTPLHINSSPAGAQVRIDGALTGKTPLDVALSSGQHDLSLQHPEALDEQQTLSVSNTPANVDVSMWRRHPDIVVIRPVFPGAPLLDAQFLKDGQVALVVGLPAQATARSSARELWLFDPATGQLRMMDLPVLDSDVPTLAASPDDDHVAFVRSGTHAPATATGWQVSSTNTAGATPQPLEPDSVWVASTRSSQPPRRLFELPTMGNPAVAPSAERIVDLVWTPDGSRLVAIAREPGPPVRTRIFLLSVTPSNEPDNEPIAEELVALPADVLVGSAVTDPDSRWLALVAIDPVTGASSMLSLCVVELQSGGMFRDVADLGPDTTSPVTAPVAWSPSADAGPVRVIFVGPVSEASSSASGLFGIFGALRPAPASSGLFAINLEASMLQSSQPTRLGRAINNFGLVWRYPTTLYAFARQDDGSLALHSADPNSGIVSDLGVRLGVGGAQETGLTARWDTRHGYALLLARAPAGGTTRSPADPDPIRAWLVSFAAPPVQPDTSR